MRYGSIVLNEPHASVEGLYDSNLSFWHIDERFLNEAVLDLTDWHTDFLFHGLSDSRVKTVRFPYSRFIVDAERLWNDPMESIGQGILYRQFGRFSRTIPAEAEKPLHGRWQSHQRCLKSALASGSSPLLLDCHSFPARMSDVDICIGYNEDWSKPNKETIELAVNLFEDNGYKVGINEPYSNSETPACPFLYQSMMLEVNKKAYMEPDSLRIKQPDSKKSSIRDLMNRLLAELL